MKFLCIILSLYVVLLSVRPCCTDDVCAKITSIAKKQTGKLADNNDCGTCSPFYRCGNCTGFTALAYATPDIAVPGSIHLPYTAYRQPFIKDVSQAIWQPPRLG
ncbi:MAG: DUF6660 family protein [Mucilaginibacter sp.]